MVHYIWEYNTSVHFAKFSTAPSIDGEPRLSKGTVKTFCTVDFTLYATKTPRYKWIDIKLLVTDAVGMNSSMGNDNNLARGFFNKNTFVYVFPGDCSLNNSQLPPGWSRPYIEPHTPNSATTYTSTTGWSVGVEGGGDKDGPKANVTLGGRIFTLDPIMPLLEWNSSPMRRLHNVGLRLWMTHSMRLRRDSWCSWGPCEGRLVLTLAPHRCVSTCNLTGMIVSDCFQPLSAGNARNARAYTGHPLLTRAASRACDSCCKCILIALGMCWTKLMLCYNVLHCKVVSG